MTTVTFLTEESRIIGFEVSGHSGYADAGEDIVCAAITSAVRLVEATHELEVADVDTPDDLERIETLVRDWEELV